MKKPAYYYENLPAAMVDMNDPDVPESVKIRAWNEMQNHMRTLEAEEKEQALSQQHEQELCHEERRSLTRERIGLVSDVASTIWGIASSFFSK